LKGIKVVNLVTVASSLVFLYFPTKAIAMNQPSTSNSPEETNEMAQSTTVVTGIQLQETEQGLTLFLETSTGGEPQTFQTTYGETLIIDLINTQLGLPSEERFQQENPMTGIASIEVTQQYANTVRVKLVGETNVPTAAINPTEQGIVFGVNSEAIA